MSNYPDSVSQRDHDEAAGREPKPGYSDDHLLGALESLLAEDARCYEDLTDLLFDNAKDHAKNGSDCWKIRDRMNKWFDSTASEAHDMAQDIADDDDDWQRLP